MWPNQSAHAQQPLIAMQRRAPNNFSALAACQLQTSSCGAFTFKGRDGAGCCCSWRTRPASGSLPRPAKSDRSAWWVHPGALGSRTSGCGQILDKKDVAYRLVWFEAGTRPRLKGRLARASAWQLAAAAHVPTDWATLGMHPSLSHDILGFCHTGAKELARQSRAADGAGRSERARRCS